MKSFIKIFILLCLIIPSLTYANQIDFYWKNDVFLDTTTINNNLNNFYKKTGLNTDIIILWKWDNCYLENNFDSCIQKNYNYSSDLLIVLSMKSDIKNKWDIRSLIKDDLKEVIKPSDLKNIQDSIISYLKNNNYTWWLNSYLSSLTKLINNKCVEVWLNTSCKTRDLVKEYHNFIAEKEYEKKYNSMLRIMYLIIFIIIIIVTYILLKKFYIYSINNLHKDIKYQISSIWDYELFEKDKKEILINLNWLYKYIQNKLWDLNKNTFYLRRFYKENKELFQKYKKEIFKMQESFRKKEKLKNEVEKMKKINL